MVNCVNIIGPSGRTPTEIQFAGFRRLQPRLKAGFSIEFV